MKLSRPSRFVAALIALFSVLFMQLAVAGYACPAPVIGHESGMVLSMAEYSDNAMPGCDSLDVEQPHLCHAHAQIGKQSLDKPELPPVQPFVARLLTAVVQDIGMAYHSEVSNIDSPRLTRTTAPPLSIRNCCFRI